MTKRDHLIELFDDGTPTVREHLAQRQSMERMLIPPAPLDVELGAMCDIEDADLAARARGPHAFKTGHCERKAEWIGLSLDYTTVRRTCDGHKSFLQEKRR
jgi:hypothetical protein